MWDYAQIPKIRAALAALTQQEREALTWETATQYLRKDTISIALWQGMKERRELTPFQAVCRANGFGDAP